METATAQSQFLHLGKKLYEKRMEAGLSIEECARFIHRESNDYESFEIGSAQPSLIELEALSYLFGVLPETFWEDRRADDPQADLPAAINYELIARIRRRTIGLNLRKARLEAGQSSATLAELIGTSEETYSEYEMGVQEIPVDRLAKATEKCGVSLNEFLDRKSPLGSWAENQRVNSQLSALPQDLKDFAARPINQPFLELAKKLSEMPVQQLREIAEGILEITL